MISNKSNKKLNEGFSFVEILVVIIIIGLLVSIGYGAYGWIQTDSKTTKSKIALQRVSEAKTYYYLDNPKETDMPSLSSLTPYLQVEPNVGETAFYNGKGSLFEGCFPASSNIFLYPNVRGSQPYYTNY